MLLERIKKLCLWRLETGMINYLVFKIYSASSVYNQTLRARLRNPSSDSRSFLRLTIEHIVGNGDGRWSQCSLKNIVGLINMSLIAVSKTQRYLH